ncbi:hypothetical protein L1987_73057 [Smallanthus sonchifolius]|uniref:Uncharacterized protein n=1 Tax=Smallanthus sonchifolius TaxID=185202 RepID=A0ACB9A0M7_9ASTR|nr:hypothetical protein L1987_73057 [Smallanthus sonchifolius]
MTHACMDLGVNVEGKSPAEELVNSEDSIQLMGKNIWEEFCKCSRGVKWPETWCQLSEPDRENVEWDQALERAKEAWNGLTSIDNHEGYQQLRQALSHKAGPARNPSRWMDVEHETCQLEEAHHRKMRKKRKTKGSNKSKHSQSGAGRKESHMSKLDALFDDLVARKEKLRSIVSNINATDENKKLVNSILCMKKFKVLKFSAKMNDEGNVTIDENMVELDTGTETIPVTQVDKEDDQSIRIVETKNRFLVLNKDGVDIDGDRITQDRDLQVNSELEKGNEGWRKRQERTLNMRFRNRVTQEQRFEAKRLIIDRLVPLESSLSEWTPSALEYFRHLCSIFDFGEGLQAVARDRFSDQDNPDIELDHNDEEVASEIDGIADLMKTDAPAVHHAELDDSSMLERTNNQPLTDGLSPVGTNCSHL